MTIERLSKNLWIKLAIFAVVSVALYYLLKGKGAAAHTAVGAAAGLAAAVPAL